MMENQTQILLRTSRRFANQINQAAAAAGLSRHGWIIKNLIAGLSNNAGSTTQIAILRAVLTCQLLLEASLVGQIGPNVIREIRLRVKGEMEKQNEL